MWPKDKKAILGALHKTKPIADLNNVSQASQVSQFKCYHCGQFESNTEKEYRRHITFNHFKKPMFPSKTELEKYGLKSQGKSWEI
jgi:hypothetical protein